MVCIKIERGHKNVRQILEDVKQTSENQFSRFFLLTDVRDRDSELADE